MTIAYGPADHPRAQGTVERLRGLLHEALGELCKTWPRRWDEYVQPALWIHRTTPDLRLPGKPTPFRIFFGRDARTHLDAPQPEVDGGDFRGGMHSYVADKRQAYKEVRDVRVALLKIHEDRQESSESRNAEIDRTSVGTRVVVGDKVQVKEAESVMAREGIHHKLAHEHRTGPWEVTEDVLPGHIVTMNGRGIRRRRASAANIKRFHLRPDDLRHDFENEFAHLAWGVDFGLAEPSIVASPMYTLIDRKAVIGQGNAWKWRYKGRFVDGRVAVAVQRGGTRQFHPFIAGRLPCAVGNVSRSGTPDTTDFDVNAEGKTWDRPRTCVETTPRGDRDLKGIRGR